MSAARLSRLFVLGLAMLLALGCGGCGSHGAAAVRQALAPLQAKLDAGHPRQGLGLLTGQPVDAAAWQRTLTLMERLASRPAANEAEACAHNLEALARAVEMYRADDGHDGSLPDRLQDVVGWGGLKAIPTCPTSGRDTCSAGWRPDRAHGTFVLFCTGGHPLAGLEKGYPRVDSRWGLTADMGVRVAHWPRPYHLAIGRVQTHGRSATVELRETGAGSAASLELTLAEQPDGRWLLAPDSRPEERAGALGHLVDTWLLLAAHPIDPAAARRACQYDLQRVATALEMYSADHRARYPERLRALVPRYLPRVPVCPGIRNGVPGYRISPDRLSYVLDAGGQQLSNRPGTTVATGAADDR